MEKTRSLLNENGCVAGGRETELECLYFHEAAHIHTERQRTQRNLSLLFNTETLCWIPTFWLYSQNPVRAPLVPPVHSSLSWHVFSLVCLFQWDRVMAHLASGSLMKADREGLNSTFRHYHSVTMMKTSEAEGIEHSCFGPFYTIMIIEIVIDFIWKGYIYLHKGRKMPWRLFLHTFLLKFHLGNLTDYTIK